LISFEGIDASGKNTQSKLLCNYFKRQNIAFESLSFPQYSTTIGSEIRNYLTLKRNYSAEAMHALYAANRYEFKEAIDNWLSEEKFVVLNRYSESNIAYGIAHGLPRVWLESLESRMPQSDYVFYLKIVPELSARRKATKDRFEANQKFLGHVSDVYDELAISPRWFTIDGDRDSRIIHYEILKSLSARLAEERKTFNVNFAPDRVDAGSVEQSSE
jgi:dTMP kinase